MSTDEDTPECELSQENIDEINRRIEDAEDPTRYMIRSDLGFSGSFVLWYDVSDDTWCNSQSSGTLFKREKHAKAVFDSMGEKKFTSVVPVLIDLIEDEDDVETNE